MLGSNAFRKRERIVVNFRTLIHASLLALFSLLAVLNASHTSARKPVLFDDAWSEVRQLFHELLEERQMVGGSLWFFQNGQPLAREFHGYADVGEERRIDENTIFHWGSITKTLTGIAIMQLRDRGRLRLEDPVVDYLPELAAAHNPYGEMDQINILHLMTHSAGFRNPTWPWGGDHIRKKIFPLFRKDGTDEST